jgi:hypothetical protein
MSNFKNTLFNPWEELLFNAASRRGKIPLFYAMYQRIKSHRRDILPFKGIHSGKRCFIMGGGPSLKLINPTPLKNEITFGVNSIFLVTDWLGFEPTYYAVEDRLVYEDRFNDILTRVNNSTCFFPVQFSSPEFDRRNHHYFRALYEFNQLPDWPNFSLDPSLVVWIGGTVTYVCLQLAYYMGFDKVYFIGMDHYYKKPDNLQENGNEWTSLEADQNHFHPDYFGKGYRWHNPRTDRMEKAYIKANKIFQADGRSVMNASVGGHLETFKRVSYDSLF